MIFQENETPEIHPLVMSLVRAFRGQALIDSRTYWNTANLTVPIEKEPAFVVRMFRLMLLAPEIIYAIHVGTMQKSTLKGKVRKEMPVRWEV